VIKDELIELFIKMADVIKVYDKLDNYAHYDPAFIDEINAMHRRIDNGEMYQLGETRTEMSPQVARDYLGLSRPWDVILLCKNGELDHRIVVHESGNLTYWITKASLKAYAKKQLEKQRQAFDSLREIDSE